ncbi:MAG: ABC transporter permease [Candidatus Methanoperedens sp.]|nr:ABC transporter permease [Candidatus Methanoperedens sp.]MCZ7403816.1 ABC transporter permease [Candidatus Methanoperedens sp.]
MRKWSTIAKHEYTYNIRRKEFLFVTFGLPLFFLVIGGLPILLMSSSISHEELRIGYVDKTGLFDSMNFTKYADEELAKKDLFDNKITHFFVIPANYTATGRIEIFSAKKRFSEDNTIEDQIKSFLLDNLLKGEKREIVERVKNPINSEFFTLDNTGGSSKEGISTILVPIAFAMFFMISIFTSSSFLLQGVVEEKENRVMEILLSSVSYKDLLIGKVFGLGAVGLTQILIWQIVGIGLLSSNPIVSAIVLDKVHVSIPILLLASIYFILGYFVFASIMAGVGAVATTSREGQQLAGIFTITGAIPLIISEFMIANPNALLVRALSYFPLTSPITMIMRLSLTEVPLYEIVISILVLAASTYIIIELSVRVFRASLLMSGKKPTISELIKYVRSG